MSTLPSKYNQKPISLKLDIPIIVDSNQAKAIAQTSLFLKELEKSVFEFALPLKYIALQINDLIKFTNLPNLLLRITKVSFTDEGFLKITAVKDNIEIYSVGINEQISANKIPVKQNISPTNFEILDLPLLQNQIAAQQYLTSAICPLSPNWNGCAILESADGYNFTQIASVNSINTLGNSINALNAALPNIIDTFNTLEVCLISGELESIANLQFLNYGNLAIVGDEIIQFQNATLLSNGNYLLSNFVRGLFGTEDKINSHTAGEKFILIDNLTKIPVSLNYLGVKKYYKCVSFGIEESDVVEVKENTFLANSLKPLSPVSFNVKGAANAVEFSWIRRARYGANLKDYFEIALDEPQEIYEVEILLNNVLKNTYRITSESKFVYQNSSQLLDLGFLINLSVNNNVSIKVYQISLTVGRSKPLTFNL